MMLSQVQLIISVFLTFIFVAISTDYLKSDQIKQLVENLIKYQKAQIMTNTCIANHLDLNACIPDSNSTVVSLPSKPLDPIAQQLFDFSPYFVFSDSELNHLMLDFLNDNLPGIKTLQDPSIIDAFEVSNYKFLVSKVFETFGMRAFVHEILIGSDEPLAQSIEQWYSTVISRLVKFNLPQTMKAYEESIRNNYLLKDVNLNYQDLAVTESLHLIELMKNSQGELFNPNLSKSELENIKSKFVFSHKYAFEYVPSLDYLFYQTFHNDFINNDELKNFFSICLRTYTFSQSLFDRVANEQEYLLGLLTDDDEYKIKQINFMKALYNSVTVEVDALSKYFWTRNAITNPFDLQEFIKLEGNIENLIQEIIMLYNPSLYQTEMFIQIIESNIYNFQTIRPIENSIFNKMRSSYYQYTFFKLIQELSTTPVNMFVSTEDGNYINFFQLQFTEDLFDASAAIANLYSVDFGIHKYKLRSVIHFFFIDIKILKLFYTGIVDKLDLNQTYVIDDEFSKVIMGEGYNKFAFAELPRNESLSFKKIVDSFKVDGLIDIFTSNPEKLPIKPDSSVKPVSLSDFLNYGI